MAAERQRRGQVSGSTGCLGTGEFPACGSGGGCIFYIPGYDGSDSSTGVAGDAGASEGQAEKTSQAVVSKPTVVCQGRPEEVSAAIVSETTAFGEGRLYGEKLTLTAYPAEWRISPEELEKNGSLTDAGSGHVILPPLTEENRIRLEKAAEKITEEGGTAVLLWGDNKSVGFEMLGERIELKKCQEVFFAATDEEYRHFSLDMLYNGREGYIDVLGGYVVDTALEGSSRVFTYARGGFYDSSGVKGKLPFVLEIPAGRGKLLAVSLETEGRMGVNANLDALLRGR